MNGKHLFAYKKMKRAVLLSVMSALLISAAPAAEAVTGELTAPAGVILIGDSRTEGMHAAVGDAGCVWVYQTSMGYNWMRETAVPQVEELIGQDTKVVCLLGVNDIGSLAAADKYASYLNEKAEAWQERGAQTIYVSVTRCASGYHSASGADNAHILVWNAYIQSLLTENVIYLDVDALLGIPGTVDGLHYTADSYTQLFSLLQEMIGTDGETVPGKTVRAGSLDADGLISGFITEPDSESDSLPGIDAFME